MSLYAAYMPQPVGRFNCGTNKIYRIAGVLARTFPDFDALKKANFNGLHLA